VGVWPVGADAPGSEFIERIQAYITKALHEAKIHSSWLNQNVRYDEAVKRFVARILDPEHGRAFLDTFLPFQQRVARFGALNSLAQTLLKFTVPGVADTYQGTELPDFSLVDPDNRRPVDYELRQTMLNDIRERVSAQRVDLTAFARELSESVEDGRAKLYVTWRTLHARRHHSGLFNAGEYLPLVITGEKSEHIFAFARQSNDVTALVAVPRLFSKLHHNSDSPKLDPTVWANTRVRVSNLEPGSTWMDLFTGHRMSFDDCGFSASNLFAHFPVALLFPEKACHLQS
jgi:(1->4)-alpha-D-glucan 1-alpha-D-glucosylmutase